MMEIPAGKWCGECPLSQYDSDDRLFYCNHPSIDGGKLKDAMANEKDGWLPLRCPACLAAYPNGATIEIKPKEVHR